MNLDLNSKTTFSDRVNHYIDDALVHRREAASPREYLGGSQLGADCPRQMQFQFFNTRRDFPIDGRKARIFELGHTIEELAVNWFHMAGFGLVTRGEDGEQLGFETPSGIRGHIDGKLVYGPPVISYPALWECKGLKASSWRDTRKKGVKKSKPEYHTQTQVYMLHMGLKQALFTAMNKDTCELYHEVILFDPVDGNVHIDRGNEILQACQEGRLLERISRDPAYYKCRMCDWRLHCDKLGD